VSIATIVTDGFGTFGSIGEIVTGGFASGDNNVISDQDAQKIANAVWNKNLDGMNKADQLMRLFAAVLGGKVSGMDGRKPAFRNLLDTKDVIEMVTDKHGNRVNAIILDLNE
jgi:hypothetical protein